MKPLPLGIQTFESLITGGFVYVDKTRHIRELLRPSQGMYFLSRPRRFGKSLLVTTLKAIFEGKRELFEGLAIAGSDYGWQEHPVIHIDMSVSPVSSAEQLDLLLGSQVEGIAARHGIEIGQASVPVQFGELIEKLSERNRVVILIDEYDKPILDNITEPETRQEIKDVLSGFYGVIKPRDAHLRFVLLTGVSRFSQVSVFSKLNNLTDLTFGPAHADLLGYTDEELGTYFGGRFEALQDELSVGPEEFLREVRRWYNGYRFSTRDVRVYNPVSVMLMLENREFQPYWFETGTPTFLVKLLKQQRHDLREMQSLHVPRDVFATYEIDNLEIEPLLVQTGYLTIRDYSPESGIYALSYPNFEVESAFSNRLLSAYSTISSAQAGGSVYHLAEAVRDGDIDGFLQVLRIFFAGIPDDIQLEHEKYYQSVFYLIFCLLGHQVEAESRTADGRIDAVIQTDTEVFIFEFKLYEPKESALAQIREKEYHLKYLGAGKAVHLIGVEFDREKRNIGEWDVETLPAEASRGVGD